MSLPRVRTPNASRGARAGTRRKKRRGGIIGGIGAGILGALGGLFGGGMSRAASTTRDAAPQTGRSRGTGKANYGPLPSFIVQTKTVRKFNNPSLATISLQMVMLLKEMGLVESALSTQFKQQQVAYVENARVQREINTESKGAGFVPFVGPNDEGSQLGSLSVRQLSDSYLKFSKALDDATEALNNMDCSCDGGDMDFPTIIPTGNTPTSRGGARGTRANIARLVEAGKGTRFISKTEALNKKGLLKAGYEAVLNKRTGAVVGYKKMTGRGGQWARRAGEFSQPLGRAAERISGGINAGARAVNRYAITPAANLISRSTQFLKRVTTRGATAVSQSAFTRNAARFVRGGINLAKKAGEAVKSGAKAVGRFALSRGLTIAFIAYESWNAYQEIKALPAKLTARQRKNAIAKIIGRLIGSIGLIWAGAALGTLLGTAVPGPGWLVGFLGGLIGGLAADFFFGNSVDKLVDMAIDALYPADKSEEAAKKVPAAKKEEPMPSPMSAARQGEGAVPFQRPAATGSAKDIAAAIGTTSNKTVNDLINETATRVGIDPALMSMIASENTAFDPKKQVQSVNGSEIFKLTPSQWSSLTSRYGPKYPELYAGINDPKAATTAGALLIKDSQDFLTKNDIPATPLSLYGSYLFGYEGLRKLLDSQPSTVASTVLPDAALARPELFKDAGGEITADALVQRLYKRTLPQRQKAQAPQGVPAIPPTTMPKVEGLPSQQQNVPPPSPPSGGDAASTAAPAPTPSATPAPGPASSAAAEPSATPDPSATPAPSDTPAPASTATPAPASTAAASPAAAEPSATPIPVPTNGAMAEPVPPSPTTASGATVDEKTRELENTARAAQTGAEQSKIIQLPGGRRAPAVLPSSSAGYTGTGNVPDPTYMLMDQYEYQFRFKSSPVLATAQTSWA